MWHLKLKTMFITGLLAVAFGVCVRLAADSWSRDIVTDSSPTFTSVRHFDTDRYRFFLELGTWLIGFGLILVALAMNQWVTGEPTRPADGEKEKTMKEPVSSDSI